MTNSLFAAAPGRAKPSHSIQSPRWGIGRGTKQLGGALQGQAEPSHSIQSPRWGIGKDD